MKQISRSFPRGACPIRCYGPDDAATPLVLFFPDAFGLRPAGDTVGEELAAQGWRVLMPDPFYQYGDYEPIAPKSIFEQGPAHDRLMGMFSSITPANIADDAAALLAVAAELSDPETPFAAVGYCMGGRFALSAACQSARVRFAGAIHASKLAPLDEDGPHRHFAEVQGRIYIGVAGIDPSFGSEEHGRLAQALREADIDHIIENYKGAAHGWVFPDIPIYDAAAAARLMRRLQVNLGEVFAS